MTAPNSDELRVQAHKIAVGIANYYDDSSSDPDNEISIGTGEQRIMRLTQAHDQQLLEAILEGQNEYELDMHGFYDKDVSNVVEAVPVEHIKSVFNKEGE